MSKNGSTVDSRMALSRHISRTLYWDGRAGHATIGMHHVPLARAPRVCDMIVTQVDYAPVVGLWMVLHDDTTTWRHLTDGERAWIDERLVMMRDAGVAVWT